MLAPSATSAATPRQRPSAITTTPNSTANQSSTDGAAGRCTCSRIPCRAADVVQHDLVAGADVRGARRLRELDGAGTPRIGPLVQPEPDPGAALGRVAPRRTADTPMYRDRGRLVHVTHRVEPVEVTVGILPWPQDGNPCQRQDPEHGGYALTIQRARQDGHRRPGYGVIMAVTHRCQSPAPSPCIGDPGGGRGVLLITSAVSGKVCLVRRRARKLKRGVCDPLQNGQQSALPRPVDDWRKKRAPMCRSALPVSAIW